MYKKYTNNSNKKWHNNQVLIRCFKKLIRQYTIFDTILFLQDDSTFKYKILPNAI